MGCRDIWLVGEVCFPRRPAGFKVRDAPPCQRTRRRNDKITMRAVCRTRTFMGSEIARIDAA